MSSVDWEEVEKKIAGFDVTIFPLESCTWEEQLGTGAAMTVYKGTCIIKGESKEVAFKEHRKFKNRNISQRDVNKILDEFRHEITLMKRLKYHPNIIQIFGVTFSQTKRPIVVVELATSTLDHYLGDLQEKKTRLDWVGKIMLCRDVLIGLQGLHDADIVHGDIKGENILVIVNSRGNARAKISDFGYSSTLSSKGGIGGTPNFMAPEAFGIYPELQSWQKKPTQDIYGFGMVTFQVATDGTIPYDDEEEALEAKAADPNLETLLSQLPPDIPAEFRSIIVMTTKFMPNERASLEAVDNILIDLNRNFFSGLNSNIVPIASLSTSNSNAESISSQLTSDSNLKSQSDSTKLTTTSETDILPKHTPPTSSSSYDIPPKYETRAAVSQSFADHSPVDRLPLPPPVGPRSATVASEGIGQERYQKAKQELKEYCINMRVDPTMNLNQLKMDIGHPLIWSARTGKSDILWILIKEYGADVDIKDQTGWTLAHWAALNKKIEIIKLLSELGADFNVKNNSGQIPSEMTNSYEMKELLHSFETR